MATFSYNATDQGGKIIKGVLEAVDQQAVADELDAMGYIPIRIRVAEKKSGRGKGAGLSFSLPLLSSRISPKDTMLFTQDLAALLSAGLPLDRSLTILVDACGSKPFRAIITDILHSVEKGHYLSDALAKQPKVFSRFYVSMVKAGEAGGVLEDVLARMAIFLETAQELKEYIASAMLYPAFLTGVGGVSIIVLLTFVLPRFSVIFENMGQSIPLATQLLLSFSAGLKAWWWLIAIVITGGIYAFKKYARSEQGRYRLDGLKLRMPMVGDLTRKIEVARFSRTLGTLVHSGVPILQALDLVRNILTNRVIAEALEKVHRRVKEGEKLAGPLADIGVFPALAIQMIMVGEETGRLDAMLLRVADNYEKIVRNLIKQFIGMLEPVMILAMGLLIGFIVITMLMAIFSINDLPF
ncbi:MAG: type II secretion system F family protein [Proteobacteria bacterium]|nr:type II secretion system F family protein [Pseudomonadota bacterium]MBU1715173.1 type II secretion system F family protein [Pseudomonadota bacterium]